jgi:hypothetical protein
LPESATRLYPIAGSSTPAELTALLKSELDKWGPIIKEMSIKPD